MKEIIIHTQAEMDKLPKKFEEFTRILIRDATERISVEARENSSVEAWGNSSVEARGNSSVEAWENSSVEAWGNSSVVAWGNSSVEAWENSSVEAWGNSSVVAWDNSSVEAWENSYVEAWGNCVVRVFNAIAKLILHGFSVAFLPVTININIQKESKHAHVQIVRDPGWFERNAVEKKPAVILYKKVSKDFKTQEGTKNETLWTIGSTVTHPKWNPTSDECGEGKFHACSRPYFCDEFRNSAKDRYIAIKIAEGNLYEWKDNPSYPHKIGFREGEVLYECNKQGKRI